MKRLFTTTAIVAAMAMPAFAEQHASGTEDAMSDQAAEQTVRIEASNLIDMRIYMPGASAEGEPETQVAEVPDSWQMVGDIDDLIVTSQGEVRALLVDAGGFLGMGETERRIPVENIRFVADSDDAGMFFVVYNGDRSKFESEGRYDPAQAESTGEMRASTNEQMAGAMDQSPQRQQESIDWSSVTTEDVLGAAVYGSNDEWIGDLSELNLAEDGSVEGVIIDVGGFLGIGEKPVEMSIDQVDLRRTSTGQVRAFVSANEQDFEAMNEWMPSAS